MPASTRCSLSLAHFFRAFRQVLVDLGRFAFRFSRPRLVQEVKCGRRNALRAAPESATAQRRETLTSARTAAWPLPGPRECSPLTLASLPFSGFIAATSMKLDGNHSVILARGMVTELSLIG